MPGASVIYQNCHNATRSRDTVASNKKIHVTALAASSVYLTARYTAFVRSSDRIHGTETPAFIHSLALAPS